MTQLLTHPTILAILAVGSGGLLLGGILWTGCWRLAIGASALLVLLAIAAAGAGLSAAIWMPIMALTVAFALVVAGRCWRERVDLLLAAPSFNTVAFLLIAPPALFACLAHVGYL